MLNIVSNSPNLHLLHIHIYIYKHISKNKLLARIINLTINELLPPRKNNVGRNVRRNRGHGLEFWNIFSYHIYSKSLRLSGCNKATLLLTYLFPFSHRQPSSVAIRRLNAGEYTHENVLRALYKCFYINCFTYLLWRTRR